jgi:hypothetical protein
LVSITQQVADLRRAARQEADKRLGDRLGGTRIQLLPPCTAQPDAAIAPCKPALVVDDGGLGDQLDTLGRPLPRDVAAIAP